MIGFASLVLLNTVVTFNWISGQVGFDVGGGPANLSSWMLLGALAGVVLSTDLGLIPKTGIKPLVAGVAVRISVALVSLLPINLFGPADV